MKKLNIVNAWVFTTANTGNIPGDKFIILASDHINGRLDTPDGTVKVELGEWIVQTIEGDYYALKTHELVQALQNYTVSLSQVQKGTKLGLRNGLTAIVSHVMPKDSISPYPITGYIEGSENMPLTWAMNGQNFISQPSNFDVVEIKG